jgi:hypothetical protein
MEGGFRGGAEVVVDCHRGLGRVVIVRGRVNKHRVLRRVGSAIDKAESAGKRVKFIGRDASWTSQ